MNRMYLTFPSFPSRLCPVPFPSRNPSSLRRRTDALFKLFDKFPFRVSPLRIVFAPPDPVSNPDSPGRAALLVLQRVASLLPGCFFSNLLWVCEFSPVEITRTISPLCYPFAAPGPTAHAFPASVFPGATRRLRSLPFPQKSRTVRLSLFC